MGDPGTGTKAAGLKPPRGGGPSTLSEAQIASQATEAVHRWDGLAAEENITSVKQEHGLNKNSGWGIIYHIPDQTLGGVR